MTVLSVVIPVYNEENGIAEIDARVLAVGSAFPFSVWARKAGRSAACGSTGSEVQ